VKESRPNFIIGTCHNTSWTRHFYTSTPPHHHHHHLTTALPPLSYHYATTPLYAITRQDTARHFANRSSRPESHPLLTVATSGHPTINPSIISRKPDRWHPRQEPCLASSTTTHSLLPTHSPWLASTAVILRLCAASRVMTSGCCC
jgi:hypothetical protein